MLSVLQVLQRCHRAAQRANALGYLHLTVAEFPQLVASGSQNFKDRTLNLRCLVVAQHDLTKLLCEDFSKSEHCQGQNHSGAG